MPKPPPKDKKGMSFPTVLSATGQVFGDTTTSHLVEMPATVDAGDLLLVLFSNDGGDTVTTPGGWTCVFSDEPEQGTVRLGAYIKVAVGDEDGTTVDFVTVGTGEIAASHIYRIEEGTWEGTTSGVEAAVDHVTVAGGPNVNPDPPSLTPTWGAEDNLWIACYGADDHDAVTVWPTDYTDTLWSALGDRGDCCVGSCRRERNGSPEDPDAFTIASAEEWSAATICIRPATGQTPSAYELKYRKGDATVVIKTYPVDDPLWNQTFAIQVGGTKYYAQCDSNLSHANASDLRIRVGGVTYAVLTEEGTPT